MTVTAAEKKIIEAVRALVKFEEDLGATYAVLGEVCPDLDEFWSNASFTKQTTANLYHTIAEDIPNNAGTYRLVQPVNGSFISMQSSVISRKKQIEKERLIRSENLQYFFELEKLKYDAIRRTGGKSVFPIIDGSSESFDKLRGILSQIQERHLRLLRSAIEYCSKKSRQCTG